ncbi:MAG: DUF481 domain-containing protein [Bacteroidota bacterium]|nr:DUF481 domain-containing protein [Bacteroidota bacterium]
MVRLINIVLLYCFFNTCLAQVINIESKRFIKDTNGFVGNANLNFSINQNVQQVMSLGINVHAQYLHNKQRILAISDLLFIKAGEKNFVNAGYQHLRYNYKIVNRLTLEAFVQAQYNLALLLNRRYLSGIGPRFKIIKKHKVKLYAGSLYMYEFQSQNNDSLQEYNHRVSSYFTLNVALKSIDFVTTTYFQPNINEVEDYRIANDSSFELQINKSLNFRAGINLLYDTRQPRGIPALSYIFKNGITFKF